VGTPLGQSPSDGLDVIVENPGGAIDENADVARAAEQPEPAPGDLPMRQANRCLPVERIRCMDDPEILERVLEGLLNLF
jgi:hypothetical protein